MLNLARKWRSRQFKDVIGQELSVRIIKNSLYKNTLFPVYLFTGQHGCGKTSTARVFAAAINCEQLLAFQRDPKNELIPCLRCQSCRAMTEMRHPDFIEIDAASNTGVDNVRNIIDASSLLPVMGSKKIYLIDEAHMLSKAAFNAFLKILEDPPASVVFILATTNADKIIDTVRSRCFRLIFSPVSSEVLIGHLVFICDQEAINYEDDALALIVQESRGAVRDALNLLEQVRFSTNCISAQAVRDVLGHVNDDTLITLFGIVLEGSAKDLIVFFEEECLARYSAEFLWRRLVELIQSALRLKYNVGSKTSLSHVKSLQRYLNQCSVEDLTLLLERFYSHELLFTKTVAQHELLEMILLQNIQSRNGSDDPSGSTPQTTMSVPSGDQQVESREFEDQEEDDSDDESETQASTIWSAFLQEVQLVEEPLLSSIMHQATVQRYDIVTHQLYITFSDQHQFFKELLGQMDHLWQPLLHNITAAANATLHISFVAIPPIKLDRSLKTAAIVTKETENKALPKALADFSDRQKWPKTHLVLDYFPGTVREVRGV